MNTDPNEESESYPTTSLSPDLPPDVMKTDLAKNEAILETVKNGTFKDTLDDYNFDVPPRPVRFFKDPDGREMAAVLLADKTNEAILWREDYERLKAQGVSLSWNFHANNKESDRRYVVLPGGGQVVQRLITRAKPEQHVRFLSSDTLNLRRQNLRIINVQKGLRKRKAKVTTPTDF